jgi:signal transduction histidine kinase
MTPRTVRVLAWGSMAISVALCAVGVGLAVVHGTGATEASQSHIGLATTVVLGLLILTYSFVGATIATRRPDNWIGWLFCANGALVSLQNFATSYSSVYDTLTRPGTLPGAAWFALLSDALWTPFLFTTTAFLFLLFPEGRPASRGRRNAVVVGAVAGLTVSILAGLLEPHLYSYPDVPNPIGVQPPSVVSGSVMALAFVCLLGVLVYSVANLFVRLRRSSGDERLQFRWFAYAVVLILVLFIPSVLFTVAPAIFQVLGGLALISLPIVVGISILRLRLYEIDVVIRKTIVYAVLAALIVLVGAALIFVVGGLAVGPVSNNRTLLIGAGVVMGFAIWPLRRAASRIADRIVFRGRETPYEVLTTFADRVAETYSTDDVLPRMAQVLATGTGAESATVWLHSDGRYRVAAIWPAAAPPPDVLPIDATKVRHQAEVLGALSVTMPANDPMNPSKHELIRDLASQAGLVLRNVRLIDDLRESRRRIVAAQDERAKALERNIHDGAQQQLVALQVKLRLADGIIDRDPARAHELMAQLQAESNDALENLRDLARGIFPPLLADKGLAAALEAQARKATVPVSVDADGIGRFPQDVEATVYFCTLEALTNVAKYAGATKASIRLANGDGELRFEVSDDGRGFDPGETGYGTGLQGMADRLAAVGGSLSVDSAPECGTTVAGSVPVDRGAVG